MNKSGGAELFEYLSQCGLGKSQRDQDVILTVLDNWSEDKLQAFCRKVEAILPEPTSQAQSPFEFIATSSLGGGDYPCAAAHCRQNQINELGQFAALYAERVLIPNFFRPLQFYQNLNSISGKYDIATCIAILLQLRPLIESELVGFSKTEASFCTECYEKIVAEHLVEYKNRIDDIVQYLRERFIDEVEYIVEEDNGSLHVHEIGPVDLIEHGSAYHTFREPPPFIAKKALNAPAKLTKKEVLEETSLIDTHVNHIVGDLFTQNYYANLKGYNYLTHKNLNISLMNFIESKGAQVSSIHPTSGLSHHVPIIPNADLSSLVDLRDAEQEAFAVYRDALSEAMSAGEHCDITNLRSAFDDLVRPELNKLDYAIKNSRRKLKLKVGQDLIYGTAFVGLGLFGGFLPSNIGEIIGALGGYHYTTDLGQKMKQLLSEPEVVRENKFYFYWKAREISKRH